MNFPGRAHNPSTNINIRVYFYIALIVAALAALAWNIYVSVSRPIPPAARVVPPHKASSNGSSASMVDILGRDLGRLSHGQILGQEGDTKIIDPVKDALSPQGTPSYVVRPSDAENYYKEIPKRPLVTK